MSRLEKCCLCDVPTGYAGKGEDSLYLEDAGPYCDGCYDGLPAEPTSLVIEKLVMLRDDFGPVRGNEDARHIVSLAITRLLEIEKDNERLSHNQCLHEILGDDYGNLRCSKVDFLSRDLAERDAALAQTLHLQFLGYTNLAQVSYMYEDEGVVYSTTEDECNIKVYREIIGATKVRGKVVEENVRAIMEFMDEKDLLDEFQFWLNGSLEDALKHTGE